MDLARCLNHSFLSSRLPRSLRGRLLRRGGSSGVSRMTRFAFFDEAHRLFGDAFTLNIARRRPVRDALRPGDGARDFPRRSRRLALGRGQRASDLVRRVERQSSCSTARRTRGNDGCWCRRSRASGCGRSSRRCGWRRSRPSAPGPSASRSLRCRRCGGSHSASSCAPGSDLFRAGAGRLRAKSRAGYLANGRQRHALVLMKLVPIQLLEHVLAGCPSSAS